VGKGWKCQYILKLHFFEKETAFYIAKPNKAAQAGAATGKEGGGGLQKRKLREKSVHTSLSALCFPQHFQSYR